MVWDPNFGGARRTGRAVLGWSSSYEDKINLKLWGLRQDEDVLWTRQGRLEDEMGTRILGRGFRSSYGGLTLGTSKTRGTFEGELTVNEVITNNEDTESTWKMTLPSLWRFLTRLVRNSSVTNETIFQKLNFLFSKFECKMTTILPIIITHNLWVKLT